MTAPPTQPHEAQPDAAQPDEAEPDEAQPDAARLRLYNAIASLRSMGLRGVLVTTAAGYRLEARFQDLSGRRAARVR